MRIGVAIPCYDKHIPHLLLLLEDLKKQTRKPDVVAISCSSTETFPPLVNYGFPIQVITTKERKNTAENRNIAWRALDTDAISFFDAGDRMHPQRLEFVERALQNADIVLHSFSEKNETQFTLYPHSEIIYNVLQQAPSGCAQFKNRTLWGKRIHHSQVTVVKNVLHQVQFNERRDYERREDANFCGLALALPSYRNAYIANSLSYYEPSASLKVDAASS
jgi:glycosyltransferase involved in cell wall biosynthesis